MSAARRGDLDSSSRQSALPGWRSPWHQVLTGRAVHFSMSAGVSFPSFLSAEFQRCASGMALTRAASRARSIQFGQSGVGLGAARVGQRVFAWLYQSATASRSALTDGSAHAVVSAGPCNFSVTIHARS